MAPETPAETPAAAATPPPRRKSRRGTVQALLGDVPGPRREPDPAPAPPPEPEPEQPAVDEQPDEVNAAPSQDAPVVEPVAEPEPAAAAPRPLAAAPKPKRSAPAPEPDQPTEQQPVTIPRLMQLRIPTSMFELARAAKDEAGDTHEVWFLDAFDAVYQELGEVYKPRPARRSPVPQRQRRTRQPSRDPLTSYPLRLTAEEVLVLEERRKELSPPSLADFVTTIVRLRLQQLGTWPPRRAERA